jgi:hypothetical protein
MFLGLDALTWAFVAAGLVVATVIFVRNMKGDELTVTSSADTK